MNDDANGGSDDGDGARCLQHLKKLTPTFVSDGLEYSK